MPFAVQHLRESPPESSSLRFTIAPPEGTFFTFGVLGATGITISPNGRQIAFVGVTGTTQALWVRPLDGLDAKRLAGTDGASLPFWSPDSRSIGFFAAGKLKTVDLESGAIEAIADAPYPLGGSWGRDGTILFSPSYATLYRVPSSGGTPAEVLPLDTSRKESQQRWPLLLPDDRHFLYVSSISTGEKENAIYLGSLESRERTRLLNVDSRVIYSPPGFLLYDRDGALVAQRFDVDRLSVVGEAKQIAPSVDADRVRRGVTMGVSDNGVLVYRAGLPAQQNLVWMDRSGRRLGLVGEPDNYSHPALSPDEGRLAILRRAENGDESVWIIDLQRGTQSRVTRNQTAFPLWSPDGQRLMFMSNRDGPENLFWKLASGPGDGEPFYRSEESHKHAQQWSEDGRYILFDTTNDVWALPTSGDRKPFLVLGTEAGEGQPRLSPDSRWIAYTSDETGRSEVYVQPFPPSGPKWQISTAGGGQPRWRGDGKELFYLALDRRLMAVSVRADASFHPGLPQPLFETPLTQITSVSNLGFPDPLYIASADGQRFLFLAPVEAARTVPATVVTNWTTVLERQK